MRYLLIALMLFISTPAHAVNWSAWLENGTKKIRQDITPVTRNTLAIKAARNEFEPFQLVFKNTSSGSRSNIDVSISNFTGAGTISSSNVTIFKEEYLNITTVGNVDGLTGEWPDALLPKVDAYYGETRSTFPLTVAAGRVQPFWFDVYVPANAISGDYTATVTLIEGATTLYTGTVTLTVWPFTLPATSTLGSVFYIGMDPMWQGHSGLSWPVGSNNGIADLKQLYIRAGLRHKIGGNPMSITSTWDGTNYSGATRTLWDRSLTGITTEYGATKPSFYTQSIGMYYDYVIVPGHCTDGTATAPADFLDRATKLVATWATTLTAEEKAATYVLPLDEPGGGEVGCGATNPALDYAISTQLATMIKAAGLKTFVTGSRKTALLNNGVNSYWDMWNPGIYGLDSQTTGNHISDYSADISAGAKLWSYLSCMSGGCGISGSTAEYRGWPRYDVEYNAMDSRIFSWILFKNGITGELYYQTVGANAASGGAVGDPYYSLYNSGYHKNGDGTLFYPGVASLTAASLPGSGRGAHTVQIGGTHDIPIESIRLKMIREGHEDYEYMTLASTAGGDNIVQSQISTIATNTYTYSTDENLMFTARENLAAIITGNVIPATSYKASGKYSAR